MPSSMAVSLQKSPSLRSIESWDISWWMHDGRVKTIGENPALRKILCRVSSLYPKKRVLEAAAKANLPARIVELFVFDNPARIPDAK